MTIETNSSVSAASQRVKITTLNTDDLPADIDAVKVAPRAADSQVAEDKVLFGEDGDAVKALAATVSNINEMVQNTQRNIHFSIAEETGNTIIKVFNADTDELIREIPSEELQRVAEAIELQMNEGVLFKAST